MRFVSNYEVLEDMNQDLERFYQRPFSFHLFITIYFVSESFEKADDSSLKTILSAAEHLHIKEWKCPNPFWKHFSQSVQTNKRNHQGYCGNFSAESEASKGLIMNFLSNQENPSLFPNFILGFMGNGSDVDDLLWQFIIVDRKFLFGS